MSDNIFSYFISAYSALSERQRVCAVSAYKVSWIYMTVTIKQAILKHGGYLILFYKVL